MCLKNFLNFGIKCGTNINIYPDIHCIYNNAKIEKSKNRKLLFMSHKLWRSKLKTKNSNLRREKFDCHLHHEGHHLLILRPSPTKTTTQPCFDAALQVLSSKNVWFISNFNFLYIVWLDLISGFDCLVDEKKNS